MKKLIFLSLLLLILAGCGQTIVLMPNLDGSVGEITVTDKEGETVKLDQAHQAVEGESKVVVLSKEEVESTFGEALAAQPEPTAKFILYFRSGSARLTKKSEAFFPEIMKVFEQRQSTDVSVIGHTDAVGDEDYNYKLSMKRAEKIKNMLIKNGMDASVIQTVSHGEQNPLVPTPDGKAEPRNRRVEVLIR